MKIYLFFTLFVIAFQACKDKVSCHDEMIALIKKRQIAVFDPKNTFHPEAKLKYTDSLLQVPNSTHSQIRYCNYLKANILLELGEEDKAIELFKPIAEEDTKHTVSTFWRDYAIAYLRKGERSNCIMDHASASCILPIKGLGIHKNQTGSKQAIKIYCELLDRNPADYESRWLLNIAYMTLGDYPQGVPQQYLIPNMAGDTTVKVKPFSDVATDLKIDINNMAGGVIMDDFNNDGNIDIVTSGWGLGDDIQYFVNTGDGKLQDRTNACNLKGIAGGLNIIQADYNNDGFLDILVLRGAWRGEMGKDPNSLLRNNGDGTFTDVTTECGILSFHPTQTATWNDFNNDGWLDLFIGNETNSQDNTEKDLHPCELFINNQDGTFTNMAKEAKCDIVAFVKGVTSGDYDNDGRADIFLSTMDGNRILLRNKGTDNISFEDVTKQAGLANAYSRSFPTWFWDYDNDGWLDIFVCDYTFEKSLAYYVAAEKLGIPAGNFNKMFLYHNNQDGTFTNVAPEMGLNTATYAMGSNFGDIDNDGWLDMYLGTGNPAYQSLVPNRMFKSMNGKRFADVTTSARVGHLQKGHGVSFADLDNDGDQDIFIEMGGAFTGDSYPNSFFLNPGQNDNHWINLQLTGTASNRSAIGAIVKVTFREDGKQRSVYREVNSGGSFGSSPLRREIGIGTAAIIDEIEIRWPKSKSVQVFKNININQFIKITEGTDKIEVYNLKKINWSLPNQLCAPLGI